MLLNIQMFGVFLILLSILSSCLTKQIQRIDPRGYNYTDSPKQLTLAVTQKVAIPLLGSISQQIAFYPNTSSSQCSFSNIQAKYNQITSKALQRAEDSIITSILPLKSKQLIFIIDQYFYLSVFELTKDEKLKQAIPSKKINSETSKSIGSSPKMVSTEDQSTVYILSPYGYSYFNVDSLSTQLKYLKERAHQNQEIFTVEIFNKKLYIASGVSGIKVYGVEDTKQLKYLYNIVEKELYCSDFVIDRQKKLLYVLDHKSGIYVYDISEEVNDKKQPVIMMGGAKQKPTSTSETSEIPHTQTTSKFNTIPILSDYLNLTKYTVNNIDIENSDNTILIMFIRNNKNIVAEFNYDPIDKTFTFIRYFKFQAGISDIVLLKDNFVAIGNQFLGIFPVKIHPKLIKKQLNGFVSMSNIKTAAVFSPPYFVGVTPTSLVIAEVKTEKYQVIECVLKQQSQLEKIVYKANRTSCSAQTPRQYYQYCQYEKQFTINKMEIVARQEIANFVWVLLVLFLTAIVCGTIILVIMRHLKLKRIKKIEEEFEHKRNTIALPSDRISARVGEQIQTRQIPERNPTSQPIAGE